MWMSSTSYANTNKNNDACCFDHNFDNSPPDSITDVVHKLRPIMPKASPPATNFLPLKHNLCEAVGDPMPNDDKRQQEYYEAGQVIVSTRWTPTSEQLQALEELYRQGTRTPSSVQIQHITAHLRRYGRIEGKNVFYWFQNHKARERQKRRRRQMDYSHAHEHYNNLNNTVESVPDTNQSGAYMMTGIEAGQTINVLAAPTTYSTLVEESILEQGQGAKGTAVPEFICPSERNGMCQMLQYLSCAPATASLMTNTYTSRATSARTNLDNPMLVKNTTMDIFMNATSGEDTVRCLASINDFDRGREEAQTLQLFPLHKEDDEGNVNEMFGFTREEIAAVNTNFSTPCCQFFEFLPLKN